jgi:hypothetical protein
MQLIAKSHSLVASPVELPVTRRTMAIVVLKKRTLSPIAQLFIETIRAIAKPQTKGKNAQSYTVSK